MLSLEGTGVKWHQLEGFPPAYVPICHMGMIEQKTSAHGRAEFLFFPSDLKRFLVILPSAFVASTNVLRQQAGLNEPKSQVRKSKNKTLPSPSAEPLSAQRGFQKGIV